MPDGHDQDFAGVLVRVEVYVIPRFDQQEPPDYAITVNAQDEYAHHLMDGVDADHLSPAETAACTVSGVKSAVARGQ
jgi:hypothetical protein